MTNKKYLGLWDGHDAGVAVLEAASGRVLFAANEERFTRRKLEVGFPALALAEAVALCGEPDEIVVPTTDPSKLLGRLIPSTGQAYYDFRRHRVPPSWLDPVKRRFKAGFTRLPPLPGCALLTRALIARRAGVPVARVRTVDHHAAHLYAAYFTSGRDETLVLSLDGIGDAASGALAIGRNGQLTEFARFGGGDSIGLIFEEATRLLHMRELEDEGKVMALAVHADLDARASTLLDGLVRIEVNARRPTRPSMVAAAQQGLPLPRIAIRVAPRAGARLRAALWKLGPERFAAVVQRLAEESVLGLVRAAIETTGIRRLAVAGGVFANVRLNRRLREEASSDGPLPVHVFPHMGDGGLALGAILAAPCALDPYLGTALDSAATLDAARRLGLAIREIGPRDVASAIGKGRVLGWIAGRMEYGPRALGARSILARPDDPKIRDRLNLAQKKRVFFQPFCPSMTAAEARRSLADYDGRPERWMTTLYGTTAEGERRLAGVIGPDGSCRPQILPASPTTPEERLYLDLLHEVERRIGIGALLNTSFNIHGDPLVRTGEDAIDALLRSGLDALIVEGRHEIARS
jgi:carbamoyltransferase